jgi:hypothetical protein
VWLLRISIYKSLVQKRLNIFFWSFEPDVTSRNWINPSTYYPCAICNIANIGAIKCISVSPQDINIECHHLQTRTTTPINIVVSTSGRQLQSTPQSPHQDDNFISIVNKGQSFFLISFHTSIKLVHGQRITKFDSHSIY